MSSFAETQKMVKEQAAQLAIYEATLKVVARQKGGPLKMQDIAETAGIATGTLYNYFKNKLELLTFVDKRLHYAILYKIEAATNSKAAPDKKLESVIHEVLFFFKEHHVVFDLAELLGTKTKIPADEKRDGLNTARECIARIIDEGIKSGQFRQIDTAMAAKYLFSTIIGVLEVKSWLQDYEMEAEAKELTNFFMAYLTLT